MAGTGVREDAVILADLAQLTKPRVTALLTFTGAVSALVATPGLPGVSVMVAVVVGGGLTAGGAGSLNSALEGDRDARMARTRDRPVAAGRIGAGSAAVFGVCLGAVGTGVLLWLAGLLAAGLALCGLLWYVVVYTLWLKPRSPRNIVVGGAAGSFPPLVGWAAATGRVGTTALALAAVVFLWTPVHFWSLASLLAADYRRARIPMLPAIAPPAEVARRVNGYAAATVAASLAPLTWHGAGPIHLAVAALAGGWLLLRCRRFHRRPGPTTARALFVASNAYLAVVFLALAVDRTLV